MLHKDLGYNSDQVLIIPLNNSNTTETDVFRNELLLHSKIINAAGSDYLLYASTNWTRVSWEGANDGEFMKINVNYVNEYLPATYGMTIVEGRNFSPQFTADKGNVALINETTAKKIGWKDPIGKRIIYNIDYRFNGIESATVVGVVKDYHFQSLHHSITPVMLRLLPPNTSGWNVSVKISPQDIPNTLAFIEDKFEKIFPDEIFQYRFVNDDFNNMYLEEQKQGKLISYLGILAIFIACLGLYGLVNLSIQQRTKEIGIRKVIGASIPQIVWLLTAEFLKLIAIASLFAWPIAYYFMNNWLQNFPYRTNIQLWIFVAASIISVIIGIVTVSSQSIKAAIVNPVKALRYE